ncbi:MAG: hypothetical protein J4F36_11930 [Nitrosopumilaceae archaeon]|nr:hypothetical protein [Nitrosopumilaceae archaeon]
MVKKRLFPSDTQKTALVLTVKQLEIIDGLVSSGSIGGNRAEVIRYIILDYLKTRDLLD